MLTSFIQHTTVDNILLVTYLYYEHTWHNLNCSLSKQRYFDHRSQFNFFKRLFQFLYAPAFMVYPLSLLILKYHKKKHTFSLVCCGARQHHLLHLLVLLSSSIKIINYSWKSKIYTYLYIQKVHHRTVSRLES